MKIQVIAAAMMLVCVTAAEGHSWYPHDCCHDNDCKPVPCAELSYHDQDVVWRKYIYFSRAMIRDSKDGSCHVCIKEGLGASILPYLLLCVFVPKATS